MLRSILLFILSFIFVYSLIFSAHIYIKVGQMEKECVELQEDLVNLREYAEQICEENRAMAHDLDMVMKEWNITKR